MLSLMCNPVFIFNLKEKWETREREKNLWIYYDAGGKIFCSLGYLQVRALWEAFEADGAFVRLFACSREKWKINIGTRARKKL